MAKTRRRNQSAAGKTRSRKARAVKTVIPITTKVKSSPSIQTAEIPMAVSAPGSRKMSVRKTAIPVMVRPTRQGRQRKTNVAVFPVAVPKRRVDPLTGVAHSAIDVEQYTFDLALQIARPVFETLEPILQFVIGSPFGLGPGSRPAVRELPREEQIGQSELSAA